MIFHPSIFPRVRRPLASVVAAGLLMLAGSGCTTGGNPASGTAAAAPAGIFAGRTTFDFVPDPTLEAAGAVSNRPYWAKRIRDAVAGNLTRKGYQRAHGGKPGMLIAFHVIRQQGDTTSIASNYQGYHLSESQKSQADMSRFVPPNGSGTLLVDVIDPATHEIVWRTSKQTPINNLQTADARDKALGGIVADALSTIPARS